MILNLKFMIRLTEGTSKFEEDRSKIIKRLFVMYCYLEIKYIVINVYPLIKVAGYLYLY